MYQTGNKCYEEKIKQEKGRKTRIYSAMEVKGSMFQLGKQTDNGDKEHWNKDINDG